MAEPSQKHFMLDHEVRYDLSACQPSQEGALGILQYRTSSDLPRRAGRSNETEELAVGSSSAVSQDLGDDLNRLSVPLSSARPLPPFYNRPGTPLSRSSSSSRLSDILRPRSRQSQREAEQQAAALNDVADRATLASTYQTRSPYGFVFYLLSGVGYFAFLIWAYTPDRVLRQWGISWFPNREWALLLPSWICMLVVYIYIAFACYAIWMSSPPDALDTLSDGYAIIPAARDDGMHPLVANSPAVLDAEVLPSLQDLPPGLVNRVLFGDNRPDGIDNRAS